MFVVEIGSVLTTWRLIQDALAGRPGNLGFELQITLWLWLTVLFANFAEAMAEGRGKAQADTLRKTRTETIANKLAGRRSRGASARGRACARATWSSSHAGEFIPGDGEIIEGVASVDESAITGESAPVIRESGGDRSAVTGGTRVLSDWIKVRITSDPGEHVPRSDDRARRGRRAAEDTERDRAQHPARRADDRLPARGGHPAAVRDLLGRAADRCSC